MQVKEMDIIVQVIVMVLVKKMIIRKQMGFTMIELIIAIAVLAILAALTIATLDPFAQIQKSNDARRKSDLAQLQKVLEQYYSDNGQYPPSIDNSTTFLIKYQGVGLQWGKGPWGPYIDVLPKDPVSGRTYIYYSPPPYQSYYLYASLERGGSDPQACQITSPTNSTYQTNCRKGPYSIYCICKNTPLVGGQPINCGTGAYNYCNFGLTSPNVSP